jgi:predicted PurR-regulated permease PerM
MNQPMIDRYGPGPADSRMPDFRLAPGSFSRALIIVLAAWVLHGFVEAVLAACVTAVASWPLYTRFANRLPVRRRRSAAPLAFTCLMIVFVLAPMVFAFSALLGEAHTLLQEIADADQRGIALPRWLESVPLVGPWAMGRWQSELAHPGTLMLWVQQTDPARLLGWAQSLGQFTARHAIIIVFTILLLFFLYQHGEALALGCRRVLRQQLGAGVEHYIGLGTRAVRASVNSMLLVGLFDGLATAAAFALVGVPQAVVWAAITGSLALVPFLGYVAVLALALHLTVQGAAATAAVALALGCAVLLAGDKLVRPAVAGAGVGLPFVWVLLGCLGGFEVLGLVGVVIGPVVLTLARELWEQRVRDAAAAGDTDGAALAEERPHDAARAAEAGLPSRQGARTASI